MTIHENLIGHLTPAEMEIIGKVDSHIKSKRLSLPEKLQQAKLITLYDLELGHFAKEQERQARCFTQQLETIIKKISFFGP